MYIDFVEGNITKGYSIVKKEKIYYFKIEDESCKVSVNNFSIIAEYTVITVGDYIEILRDGMVAIGVVKAKSKDCSSTIDIAQHNHILPFMQHSVTTYPKHTAVLGILGAYNRDEEWLYNNYGLFWVYRWSRAWTYWTDFKYGNEEISEEFCPLIKQSRYMRMEQLCNMQLEEVVEFFKEAISKRKYHLLSLDMYYIIGWTDDLNRHVRHQAILYGYNDKRKVFYLADFFDNSYNSMEVSFENFYKAVTSTVGLGDDSIEYKYNPQIEIYEFVDEEYQIDLDRIKSFVVDFIKSRDTTADNFLNLYEHRNALYGFAAMEQMTTYMRSAVSQQKTIDVKILYIVRVFNEILKKRLEYLEQRGLFVNDSYLDYVKENIVDILKKLNKLNILCLKYDCTLKTSTGEKVISVFDEVKTLERIILERVYLLFGNDLGAEFDNAMLFRQYDLAKKIYTGNSKSEESKWIGDAKIAETEVQDEIAQNSESSVLKKIVKKHAKGKSVFTYKQYFNVFPYETEERSFVKEAQIIRRQELTAEVYRYYWYGDDIRCIKFSDENQNYNWMCYDYYDDKIVRYWIMKDVYGEYRLLGVKVAHLNCGKVSSIYSYKNLYGEIKRGYTVYNYVGTRLEHTEFYYTKDKEMLLEKWIAPRWKGIQTYSYDEKGELLQIMSEEFGEKQTIYSDAKMDEKEVEDRVFDGISTLIHNGAKNIQISYNTKGNIISVSGDDEKFEIAFFNRLVLEESEVRRIAYLIAFAVFRVNNERAIFTYLIDGKDVTEDKRYKGLFNKTNEKEGI